MNGREQKAERPRQPFGGAAVAALHRGWKRVYLGLCAIEYCLARHQRLGWNQTLDCEAVAKRLETLQSECDK
jgi:hypothetical protein